MRYVVCLNTVLIYNHNSCDILSHEKILGGIRMLKFMAWERNFEARVLKIRERELFYQKRNYLIEVGRLTAIS